jgi:hypothetical protein
MGGFSVIILPVDSNTRFDMDFDKRIFCIAELEAGL